MPRATPTGLQLTVAATSTLPEQWAAGSGTPEAIEAAYPVANTALIDGMLLGVRVSSTNATSTPTFNPDTLGAIVIKKNVGGFLVPLAAGDIPFEAILRYNDGSTCWCLLNPAQRRVPYGTAGGTVDAITVTHDPIVLSGDLVDGYEVRFRAAGANVTTTPTFSPNTLTARTIKKLGGQALVPGDIYGANHEVALRYHVDVTTPWWELINPSTAYPVDPTFAASVFSKMLTADASTFADDTSAHAIVGLGVTLPVGTYKFTGSIHTTRAAGTTSHTTSFLFGGTAVITAIRFTVRSRGGDAQALAAVSSVAFDSVAAVVVKAASTSGTEDVALEIEGEVIIGTAGTLLPELQYSVAPGGVTTPKAGSRFDYVPRTNGSGTWA